MVREKPSAVGIKANGKQEQAFAPLFCQGLQAPTLLIQDSFMGKVFAWCRGHGVTGGAGLALGSIQEAEDGTLSLGNTAGNYEVLSCAVQLIHKWISL